MKTRKLTSQLIMAMLAVAGNVSAEDKLTITPFTLNANEEAAIEVCLQNEKEYGGLQFVLTLPDGMSICEDEYGLIYSLTDRVKYGRDNDTKFQNSIDKRSDGTYFVLIWNSDGETVSGNSGDPIMTITVKASDQISTTNNQCVLSDIRLASVNGVPSEGTNIESETVDVTLQVPAKIAASGYGSFSWPRALDFSETSAKVFVGTRTSDGWLHLESVDDGKIPANTGVILKGTSGQVYPQTIDQEVTLTKENLLLPTSTAAVPVTADGYYALATKSAGSGFYLIDKESGVTIPQYKAYLHVDGSAGSRDAFFFSEDATGLQNLESVDASSAVAYDLQGRRVDSLAKGIYVKDGRKIIVK